MIKIKIEYKVLIIVIKMNLKNKIGLKVLTQESVWIQMISLLKLLEIKV
jgi:hypothetical protein